MAATSKGNKLAKQINVVQIDDTLLPLNIHIRKNTIKYILLQCKFYDKIWTLSLKTP